MSIRTPNADRAQRRGMLSVSAKLAGSTIVLILLVTIGVYIGLSRYQRANLLQSKEVAAQAVSRLFADSCAAPVTFSDDSGIKDVLAILGRNNEVEWAGVWEVSSGGNVGRLIAGLDRGVPVAAPSAVGALARVERGSDRVLVSSPVMDTAGRQIASSLIAFSLARENAAIVAVERRILAVSASVACGLTLLLIGIARLAIVLPLGKLVVAARALENGTVADLDIDSNDEIGELATAFRSMTSAIQSREERIQSRNHDMRLVLDNVGQGFITLDVEGTMSRERSRVVGEWFGPAEGDVKFWDYLRPVDHELSKWFELGWASVREDVMPLELCLAQLPQRIRSADKTFELAYRPIMKGERVDKTIVVITDISSRIQREASEQMQREVMSLFRRITSDRVAFEAFFDEASSLVDAIEQSDLVDLRLLKRQVHTLKGNCALFGLESVVVYCHELESRIEEAPELLGRVERAQLRTLWTRVTEMRRQFSQGGGRIEVEPEEYEAFLEDLRLRVDHQTLARTFTAWKGEAVTRRLALVAEQIKHLGQRLGKVEIDVGQRPTKLRLPLRKWGPFWSAFAHVIRNAVDHGIESPDERRAAGKPERGAIELALLHEGQSVEVSIQDDGRGIDWEAIRERAVSLGLPHATPRDLHEALFAEGVSSRAEVSASSGRGVGLGAVREMVQQLGGEIIVESWPGRGTRFRFRLPKTMLFDDVNSPAQPLEAEARPVSWHVASSSSAD